MKSDDVLLQFQYPWGQRPRLKFCEPCPFINQKVLPSEYQSLCKGSQRNRSKFFRRNLKLRHYSGEMYSVSGNRAVNVRPCQMDWVHPVVALPSGTQWHPVAAQASVTSAMLPSSEYYYPRIASTSGIARISFCQVCEIVCNTLQFTMMWQDHNQ